MEKSFASLLRHSKLATYDRRLNQVYSSPKHYKQHGDWGLKRNLPTVIRTPFVTVGQLDTIEHQTPWDSGYSQVAFIQRWKENFGAMTLSSSSSRHASRQSQDHLHRDDYHNLASMTRSQFDHFLKYTITPDTARAFHQALQSNQLTRDQVYDYLHVTFRRERTAVVGPIYSTSNNDNSNNIKEQEVIVQGRVLNSQKDGYAVGIGGVVALLPKRWAMGIKKPGDRSMVRTFYVRRAYIDDQGKPQVTVSLHPPQSTTTTTTTTARDLKHRLSSPTSALPSSPSPPPSSSLAKTTFDHLFATTPSSDLDDLQLFLLDSQQQSKRKSSSPTTSAKEQLLEDHSALMNRIIALLKNGTPSSKKN